MKPVNKVVKKPVEEEIEEIQEAQDAEELIEEADAEEETSEEAENQENTVSATDVILQHEERLAQIEATLFRIKSII